MKTCTSVCPYDCPDACGLVVTVDGGRVVSVAGDKSHPFTRGTLCPKMPIMSGPSIRRAA